MAHVELRRVSKVYGGAVSALRDVDLEVRDGELLVLVGPNGSGKTTVLRLIAGLERPTSGEILVDGRLANGMSPRQRDVTMLFQGCVLYPHLTVERNIGVGLHPGFGGWTEKIRNWLVRSLGRTDRDANTQRDRVQRTAQLLGVEHLLDRFPRQLSGGERQRVALGRALVRQPAVFLLDEPLSQADVRWRQRMRLELRRLKEQTAGAMVVVTHDHVEAIALADRLAVMNDGRVHQVGSPAEIAGHPHTRFVAEFFGNPPMNFVAGRLTLDGGMCWFESPHGRIDVTELHSRILRGLEQRDSEKRSSAGTLEPGREVWLGFRPDDALVRPAREGIGGAAQADWQAEVTARQKLDEKFYLLLRPTAAAAWDEENSLLTIGLPEKESLRPGEQVTVEINPQRSFLFDRRTGENLMGLN